jgi:15-cis-phytoene synthase
MQNSDRRKLEGSYSLAKALTKKYAGTFYFASHLLPREKRKAAYAIYAICRISDEAVDGPDTNNAPETLLAIRDMINDAYEDKVPPGDVWLAFSDTVTKYSIDRHYFFVLLDGMASDLGKTRYVNFGDLYNYCFKVAGVVGLMMIKILGSGNKKADGFGIDLGIALQLTNILRDIKEDYLRGRIYLPLDEMGRFGVTEDHIRKGIVDDNFREFMRFKVRQAKQYYENAEMGIRLLSDLRSRVVVQAMKEIYAGILHSIEMAQYDVFSKRATVGTPRKIFIAAKIICSLRFF